MNKPGLRAATRLPVMKHTKITLLVAMPKQSEMAMSKNSGTDTHEMHGEACSVTGERFADWLRREYPPGARAKLIARDFDASPRTVEKWLAGGLPNVPTLLAMAARWGRRFTDHVLEPLVGMPKSDQQIIQDIADMQARLVDIHARMARVKEEG